MESQLSSGFTNQGASHALNIYYYPQDCCGIKNYKHRVLGLRYILQNYNNFRKKNQNCPLKDTVLIRAIELFRELEPLNEPILNEIGDVIITFGSDEQRQLVLDSVIYNGGRRIDNDNPGLEIRIREEKKDDEKRIKAYYQDGQNVHNRDINKSVLRIASILVKQAEEKSIYNENPDLRIEENKMSIFQICNYLKKKFPNKAPILDDSCIYFAENIATFNDNVFSLQDLFVAVWFWIHNKEEKDITEELEKRFIEELEETKGKCSTGAMARLVNTIQGFTTDSLSLKISTRDQCRAVVRKYIEGIMSECKDEKVLEGLLDTNQDFINFVKEGVKSKLLDWEKDYGSEMLNNIADIVNEYCRAKVFV